MARRRKGAVPNVLSFVAQAKAAANRALQGLRAEINATKKRLQTLVGEERSFRLDIFGSGGPGRPRTGGRPRKTGRPAGSKAAVRKASRRKGPLKADTYFAKLPKTFTIDDVRKLAGKAAPISLAQWARANKVKKTGLGYQKVG